MKKIQVVGKYMVEVWKAVGMDLSKVEFLSSSEEINKRPDEYWTLVMDIARKNNLKRIVRYVVHGDSTHKRLGMAGPGGTDGHTPGPQ